MQILHLEDVIQKTKQAVTSLYPLNMCRIHLETPDVYIWFDLLTFDTSV